jgi:hypothetical protein
MELIVDSAKSILATGKEGVEGLRIRGWVKGGREECGVERE